MTTEKMPVSALLAAHAPRTAPGQCRLVAQPVEPRHPASAPAGVEPDGCGLRLR